jgi:predicted transcriptional regulator
MALARRRDPAEVMRDEMIMKDRITSMLREGPRTIPEIAEALGCPSREVTLWVMALRRYGAIEEMPKAKSEDYYQYRLAGE